MKIFFLLLLGFCIAGNAVAQRKATPDKDLTPGAALLFNKVKTKLSVEEKNKLFREMGFLLSKDGKQFIQTADDADYPFDAQVYPTDMNKDGTEEILIVWGNTFTSGITGSSVSLFIKGRSGYIPNLDFPGCCIQVLPTTNAGYPDLLIGGPGFKFPIWRWNGMKYELYKTVKDEAVEGLKATDIEVLSKAYCSSIK